MSEVRIPPVLRSATSGAKLVDAGGSTVREVIESLVGTYPALAPTLLDGDGGINHFVNVFLNGTDVRHLDGLETPVGERDSLVLLPAMAGGS
ncbi:MAG: MoaD/ThiS family protein [Chloroflexi bacterium]|nr:MoaD/ThiS family protein [Chloroflexota bacterium]